MVAPDQDSNPENFQAIEQASHGSTDELAMHLTVSLGYIGDRFMANSGRSKLARNQGHHGHRKRSSREAVTEDKARL